VLLWRPLFRAVIRDFAQRGEAATKGSSSKTVTQAFAMTLVRQKRNQQSS